MRDAHPPGHPNSFDFMKFLGKFGKIVCSRKYGGLTPPPRGNPGSATDFIITKHLEFRRNSGMLHRMINLGQAYQVFLPLL